MVEGFPVWALKAFEFAGVAGVVFVMWWFQHKSWVATLSTMLKGGQDQWQKTLEVMQEEHEKQREEMRAERKLAYEMQMKEQERDYETMTRIFDQLSLQGGITARLEGETKAIGKSVDELKRKILGT